MIHRKGIVLNPHLNAAGEIKLIGVYFWKKTIFQTGSQYSFRVVNRKESPVAKYINIIGKLLQGYKRDHLADNHINVLIPAALIFLRQSMSAQESCFYFNR